MAPSRPDELESGDRRCYSLAVGGVHHALMKLGEMTVRGKGGSEVALDLVAFLNHRSQEPPPLSMFRRREWLRLHFGQWGGARLICWCFRDDGFERGRLHFIGEVPPEPGDPTESSKAGCRWPAIAAILERVPRSTTEP